MTAATRAAVLTPPRAAAVASVAVVGPDACETVRSTFRSANNRLLPSEPKLSEHWLGKLGEPPGDTVLLRVRQLDPILAIELNCHGGRQVVQWLLDDLRTRGIAIVSWKELAGEFESSPLRAQAAIELTQSVTLRTSAILLDQYHGALETALIAVSESLKMQQTACAMERLASLTEHMNVGRHLTRPWRVAVAGPPNVGKSSLINRLVGYPRCVVTPIAGTTRDLVATPIAIDGWPVELIDTAGQRTSDDRIEQAGVALASDTAATADLTLWLQDASSVPGDEPIPAEGFLVIRNKIDLVAGRPRASPTLSISALTGEGLEELLATISRRLVPNTPPPEAAIPFSAAIVQQVLAIANLCADGKVSDAMDALRALLTGTSCANAP
jgi:tRNA modification GTPase